MGSAIKVWSARAKVFFLRRSLRGTAKQRREEHHPLEQGEEYDPIEQVQGEEHDPIEQVQGEEHHPLEQGEEYDPIEQVQGEEHDPIEQVEKEIHSEENVPVRPPIQPRPYPVKFIPPYGIPVPVTPFPFKLLSPRVIPVNAPVPPELQRVMNPKPVPIPRPLPISLAAAVRVLCSENKMYHDPIEQVQGEEHDPIEQVQGEEHDPIEQVQGEEHDPIEQVQGEEHDPIEQVQGEEHDPIEQVQGEEHDPIEQVQGEEHDPIEQVQGEEHDPIEQVQGEEHDPIEQVQGEEHDPIEQVQGEEHDPIEQVQGEEHDPIEQVQGEEHDPIEQVQGEEHDPIEQVQGEEHDPIEQVQGEEHDPIEQVQGEEHDPIEQVQGEEHDPIEQVQGEEHDPIEQVQGEEHDPVEQVQGEEHDPIEQVNKYYMHCTMVVTSNSMVTQSTKSCHYDKNVNGWVELEGNHSVCSCCDSVCINEDVTLPIVSKSTISSDALLVLEKQGGDDGERKTGAAILEQEEDLLSYEGVSKEDREAQSPEDDAFDENDYNRLLDVEAEGNDNYDDPNQHLEDTYDASKVPEHSDTENYEGAGEPGHFKEADEWRALSAEEHRWVELEGNHSVCSCCDSVCINEDVTLPIVSKSTISSDALLVLEKQGGDDGERKTGAAILEQEEDLLSYEGVSKEDREAQSPEDNAFDENDYNRLLDVEAEGNDNYDDPNQHLEDTYDASKVPEHSDTENYEGAGEPGHFEEADE
ncbi:UNVERIFIED_CONTAM: hypothetical protein FKN15_049700 [Acipenser sinensis]